MNGEQKVILIGVILGAAVAVVLPVFIFGLIVGLAAGIAIEARYAWFVKKVEPMSQTEPTQLVKVTTTEERMPIYQTVCRYCGSKLAGSQKFTKCPNCGANL